MKRLQLLLAIMACVIHAYGASVSPLVLYNKWQNLGSDHLMEMGQKFAQDNSCDSALVCYSVVADRLRGKATRTDEKQTLARALNNIGFIYGTYFFDYKEAVNALQESLRISRESDYKENIAFVNLNLGGVYLGCNMMYGRNLFSDEVWNYLENALVSAVEMKQHEVAMVAFLNMGQMYFSDHQDERLKKAVDILRAGGLPDNLPLAPYCRTYARGLEAYMNRQYDESIRHFQSMVPLIPQHDLHSSRYELIVLDALARLYEASGNYQAAIDTCTSLLSKSIAYGVSDVETNTCRMLSELYEKTGHDDMATEYLLRFHHKKDSTLTERDMSMLSKLPLVNELEEINRRLAEEHAKRRMMIIIAVVTAVFVIMLALYLLTVIRSQRKLRRYVKELYRKNRELIQSEQRARELRETQSAAPEEKYSSSSLTPPESRIIADRILQVMDNIELITNPGFSLAELAEQTGHSPKVVSQVVNETLGRNFKTLLNECRIREACVRLIDTDTYGQYTIEHIADSVGFNSRSNFSVTFKKITGLTPAQFQKNAISDCRDDDSD